MTETFLMAHEHDFCCINWNWGFLCLKMMWSRFCWRWSVWREMRIWHMRDIHLSVAKCCTPCCVGVVILSFSLH
jgi:hypothetical protein